MAAGLNEMGIYAKLRFIQTNLKAPKSQRNTFGNYNYRSCEDILEALKPHLDDQLCALTITDEIIQIGDRYYIKAIATLTDTETGKSTSTHAFAREEDSKKGMDASQLTGAASSYARKYALNGLFCIDDTKDSDATNKHGQEDKQSKPPTKLAAPKQTAEEKYFAVCAKRGLSKEDAVKIRRAGYKNWRELNDEQWNNLATKIGNATDEQLKLVVDKSAAALEEETK